MPFDNTELPTDVRNLLTLADALEREQPGFEWDFSEAWRQNDCGTVGCALGLGYEIGLFRKSADDEPTIIDENHVAEILDLSPEQVGDTFFFYWAYGVNSSFDVTPAMVAARLREIAAEKMKVS